VNISRSTAIQHVYCVPWTPLLLLLAVCLTPLSCVWLIGHSSVTERASNDQRLGSLDDTIFAAKLSRVENWPGWGPNYSVASFFLLPWTSVYRKQVTRVLWIVILIRVSSHWTCAKASNCSKIKNTVLTWDKVLNVLICVLLHSDQINTLESAWNGRNMWTWITGESSF